MCSRITCEEEDILIMSFVVAIVINTICGRIKSNPNHQQYIYFLSIFLFPLQRRKVLKSFVQLRERERVCVCVCVCVLGLAHALVRPGMLALSGSTCKAIPWSSCCLGVATKGLLQFFKSQIFFPCRVLSISCLHTHSSWLCHGHLGSLGSLGACLGTSV
jgi:hypothetical protein